MLPKEQARVQLQERPQHGIQQLASSSLWSAPATSSQQAMAISQQPTESTQELTGGIGGLAS